MRPTKPPIGLHLTQATRSVSRAFDEALAEAGGSLPVWLVLLNLKADSRANQRQISTSVGISEATLTHHLNSMERDGLITRRRDATNRRVHVVELTGEGESLFSALRTAALEFDRRLRKGITEKETQHLRDLLSKMAANVSD